MSVVKVSYYKLVEETSEVEVEFPLYRKIVSSVGGRVETSYQEVTSASGYLEVTVVKDSTPYKVEYRFLKDSFINPFEGDNREFLLGLEEYSSTKKEFKRVLSQFYGYVAVSV